jgi:hypothetical protein
MKLVGIIFFYDLELTDQLLITYISYLWTSRKLGWKYRTVISQSVY